MFTYETGILTYDGAQQFIARFDKEIGTDREINVSDDGQEHYIVCLELEEDELEICQEIENDTFQF